MAMWTELIIVPLKGSNPMCLWMDNCGCHKTDAIRQLFEILNILNPFYPPNMTAILQVLDLIVNGPIKTLTRHSNAARIVAHFKEFKTLFQAATPVDQLNIKYRPPKPQLKEAIKNLIRYFAEDFKTESFKVSIKRTFVSTGTAPKDDGTFVVYSNNQLGSQGYMHNITPVGTMEPTIILEDESPDSDETSNIQNGLGDYLDGNDYVEEEGWDDDDIISEIETMEANNM
jgi:hypothetical protein